MPGTSKPIDDEMTVPSMDIINGPVDGFRCGDTGAGYFYEHACNFNFLDDIAPAD